MVAKKSQMSIKGVIDFELWCGCTLGNYLATEKLLISVSSGSLINEHYPEGKKPYKNSECCVVQFVPTSQAVNIN